MKRLLIPLMVGTLVASGVAVDGAMAEIALTPPVSGDQTLPRDQRAKVPAIPAFSPSRDTVTLPADGRGAVGVLALPGDEVGPGPEYDALQVMGVPAQVTSIEEDLSRFRVVILAGTADAASVDQAAAAKLTDFVASGGSLIAEAATAGTLRPLLGIDSVRESQARDRLVLCAACHPSLLDVTGKTERTIELDDVQKGAGIGTVGYRPAPDAQVLGTFNDGWSAVLAHPYGSGVAYTVGARISDLVTRHLEGARFSARRGYVNGPEADGDAWLLWLRGVWQNASPGGVTLSTLPAGVRAPVVMTISANWGEGVINTPAYLKTIRKLDSDAATTVFVATHTRTDWLDSGYFRTSGNDAPEANDKALEEITKLGAELGAHGVSHSPVFNRFPIGTGSETWANYDPFVVSRTVTTGGSVLGELRVSRALLLKFASSVKSFRAPYLLTPRTLASAEDAVGYRYESSSTQGWTQTAFPFHPPRLDDRGSANVISFPIAVEDEASGGLAKRIEKAADVIEANASNGAPSTVLIHPTAGVNREAIDDLIRELRDRFGKGLSIESVESFGSFWWQRERLALMVGPGSPAAVATCGSDLAVSFSIGNTSAERATRQALKVASRSLTRAEIDNGEKKPTTVEVEDGVIQLPSIDAHHTLTGTLCP